MIGISKLYCGTAEPGDALRYGARSGRVSASGAGSSSDRKPVVVWNCTQRCDLRCVHCYSRSRDEEYADEMTTEEGKALIDDLARFGCPVVLFSGGEPLMRGDLLDLARHAVASGLRAVLSTNGAAITPERARELREVGLSYVGVSLDGLRETHDRFRGVAGSFDRALQGIRACREAGIKIGLRFTVSRRNVHDLGGVFDLVEELDVPRVCFYHLVYAGRGSEMIGEDLSHEQARRAVDLILDRTRDLHDRGLAKEVLTVDNHCDGIYLYMRLAKENPARAEEVMQLLRANGGNSSGVGIACVSWDGQVHADQFWRHYSFGNVRERPFGEIWTDLGDPLMAKLKEKKKHVKGRCAACKWLDACAGNMRVRAEAVTGDPWAPEPACYLTDEEIGAA